MLPNTRQKRPDDYEAEKLKLDPIMKVLFRLSKKLNIQLINQLFGEKILRVILNITDYLYERYGEYLTIKKEAQHMIKTLYDPRIKEQGIKEGIKKRNLEIALRMLNDGMAPDKVAKFTELPEEEVHKLKSNMKI